jgi:hypothetical protein
MKNMQIYEPAMCCSTGLCGVGVDPELLRISTVLNTMEKNGIKVERYNLSNSPQEFIKNKAVNNIIKTEGVEILPLAILDGEIIITGRYPTNEEFVKHLDIPMSFIGEQPKDVNAAEAEQGGCCCPGGDCSDGGCC